MSGDPNSELWKQVNSQPVDFVEEWAVRRYGERVGDAIADCWKDSLAEAKRRMFWLGVSIGGSIASGLWIACQFFFHGW